MEPQARLIPAVVAFLEGARTATRRKFLASLGPHAGLFATHEFRDVTSDSAVGAELRQSIEMTWKQVEPQVFNALPLRLVGDVAQLRRVAAVAATTLERPELRRIPVHLELFCSGAPNYGAACEIVAAAGKNRRFRGTTAYLLSPEFNGLRFDGHTEPVLASLLAAFALTEPSRFGLNAGFSAVRGAAGCWIYLTGIECFTMDCLGISAAFHEYLWKQNDPRFSGAAHEVLAARADPEPDLNAPVPQTHLIENEKLLYLNRNMERLLITAAKRARTFSEFERALREMAERATGVARETIEDLSSEVRRARTIVKSRAGSAATPRHATEWVYRPPAPVLEPCLASAASTVLQECPVVAPLFFENFQGSPLCSRVRAARGAALAALTDDLGAAFRESAYHQHDAWLTPNASEQGKTQMVAACLNGSPSSGPARVFPVIPRQLSEDLREEIWANTDQIAFVHLLPVAS